MADDMKVTLEWPVRTKNRCVSWLRASIGMEPDHNNRSTHALEVAMDSEATLRKRYQRFFAWSFALTTLLALGMFWAEATFSQVLPVASALAPASNDPGSFDLYGLRLLIVIAALVAALASFAGLFITTPLAWIAVRRERRRAAIETAFKRQDRVSRPAALRGEAFRSSGISSATASG